MLPACLGESPRSAALTACPNTEWRLSTTVCGEATPFNGALGREQHGSLDLQLLSLCFSISMAAFGIKVSCIEPGFFRTNVTDITLLETNMKKLWGRLPQEVKEDYGDDFLKLCKLLHLNTLESINEMNLVDAHLSFRRLCSGL